MAYGSSIGVLGAGGQIVPVVSLAGTHQAHSFTGTASTTSTFGTSTRMVRVVATAACHIAYSGTATTSFPLLPANTVEYLKVGASGSFSVIQASGNGVLHITEITDSLG